MPPDPADPSAPPSSFLAMLDRLGIGYYRSGLDGRVLAANEAAARIFGYSRDELQADFRTTQVSPTPDLWHQLRRQAEHQEQGTHFVALAHRKDGAEVYVESNIQAVREPEGGVTGFEGIFRDVTAEVSLIREQQKTLAELRHTNERMGTVASMQEQLLYSLAHDLKTPPVVIQGFSELLSRGRYGPVSPEQEKPLRTIHRNVQYMVDMVEHVLIFSRLLRGLQQSHMAFSLSRAWADTLSELDSQNPGMASRFSCLLPVTSDEVTTSQDAVHYIFSNAATCLLAIAAPDAPIRGAMAAAPSEATLRLEVPALAADHPALPRLLDSFFSERDHETGLCGLGLGAGRYVAAVIGADLTLEPLGEDGAALTLRIPR